ncbi:hypothetical protein [Rhizobium sp. ZPR3]|uniref:Uncharacterized protein n=2 Tax=unclassified Rhizobium TaxID=2613769 RepID=A0AAU7SEW9_9HYPH
MTTIKFEAQEGTDLHDRLSEQGINAVVIEAKGVAELSTLLVAVGGGAGIAAIVKQIAAAIRSYFQGRAELEKARRVKLSVGNVKIEVASDDVDTAMETLREALSKG